jgi:hypothetical protein
LGDFDFGQNLIEAVDIQFFEFSHNPPFEPFKVDLDGRSTDM